MKGCVHWSSVYVKQRSQKAYCYVPSPILVAVLQLHVKRCELLIYFFTKHFLSLKGKLYRLANIKLIL